MNKFTFTTSIISITVAAALLSGCSATPVTPTDAATPVATPTATAAPIEVPDAPEAATGEVLTADAAELLNKARNGQRAYPLADGTFMVVTKADPLPEAVQADLNEESSAIRDARNNGSFDLNTFVYAREDARLAANENTGKTAVLVSTVFGFPLSSSVTKSVFFTVSGDPRDQPDDGSRVFGTLADAQAFLDAWMVDKNVNDYAVIYE